MKMDDYMESMAILYGCKNYKPKNPTPNKTSKTDLAYARGYIIGYIDALKKSDLSTYTKLNQLWTKIDNIKNDNTRHRKVMELYRELDFCN